MAHGFCRFARVKARPANREVHVTRFISCRSAAAVGVETLFHRSAHTELAYYCLRNVYVTSHIYTLYVHRQSRCTCIGDAFVPRLVSRRTVTTREIIATLSFFTVSEIMFFGKYLLPAMINDKAIRSLENRNILLKAFLLSICTKILSNNDSFNIFCESIHLNIFKNIFRYNLREIKKIKFFL